MERGYVKLWRKSIDSFVFADPELWKLWCLCLMKANHKGRWIPLDGLKEPIKINPGQFMTGRESLHQIYYPRKKKNQKSPITLWRWLQILEKVGNLNIKSYTKYSIITISNWTEYQQNEQQMNNKRTTDEQQMNTNKNDKNVKNDNKKNIYTPEFELFWKAYPKRKGKENALKAWIKLSGDIPPIKTLLGIIEKNKQSYDWKKDNGKYIPYPSTWLNGKRWEDEIIEENRFVDSDSPPYHVINNGD